MELKDYLIEKLQLENLEDEQQLQLLDNKTKEIQQLLSQMNEIKDSVRKKIAISDRNNWASIMNTIRKEASSVAEKLELQCAADFVFPDSEEDSHLFVSFFKPDWDLSIIFEKFNYVALQSFFIYIGKPAEQNVDSKYNNICRIFRERSEQWNHPYGWEYDEKYHQKSKDLMRDVENGNFEMYLERKVKEILQQINENQLPMQ